MVIRFDADVRQLISNFQIRDNKEKKNRPRFDDTLYIRLIFISLCIRLFGTTFLASFKYIWIRKPGMQVPTSILANVVPTSIPKNQVETQTVLLSSSKFRYEYIGSL